MSFSGLIGCSFEGCDKRHHCKGMCKTHYARLYMRQHRYGRINLIRRERGIGSITNDGYICIQQNLKKKRLHVIIAEKALGRELPKGAIVHHADGNKKNNKPNNLVICPDQAYHLLLHKRMRAMGLRPKYVKRIT